VYVIVMAPHVWIKAGVALLLAGIAYAMAQWRRRAAPNNARVFESVDASLVFYKRELERKRDFHRTLWRWYLLPIAPGTLAMTTAKIGRIDHFPSVIFPIPDCCAFRDVAAT
jgi:hypothetical protein